MADMALNTDKVLALSMLMRRPLRSCRRTTVTARHTRQHHLEDKFKPQPVLLQNQHHNHRQPCLSCRLSKPGWHRAHTACHGALGQHQPHSSLLAGVH